MNTEALSAAAPYIIQQDYSCLHRRAARGLGGARGPCFPELENTQRATISKASKSSASNATAFPTSLTISARLEPRTGWNSTPVSGFLPAPAFFEMLAARNFPTTTWLRSRESLEYTPEPDIFHDVFGHVPMHAHKVFADFLEHYGRVCASISDERSLRSWAASSGTPWSSADLRARRDQGLRQRTDQFPRRVHERHRWPLRHPRLLTRRGARDTGKGR